MAGRWNDEWRGRDWRAESDWRDDEDNQQRWSGSEGRSWDRNDRVFGERESGVEYNRSRGESGRGRYGGRPDDDWVSGGASSSGSGRYGAQRGGYGGSSSYGGGSSYGGSSSYGSGSSYSGAGRNSEGHPGEGWQAADYGGVSPAMQRGEYDTGYRSNPRFQNQDNTRGGGRFYGDDGRQRVYRSEYDHRASYDEGRRFGTRDADDRWAREMRRPVSGGTGGYDYDERGYGDGGRYGNDRDFEDRARDAGDFFRRTGQKVKNWFSDATRDDDDRGYEAGHRGRGPKGYKRSDERVSEDAHQRLTDDPWLDASSINVSVSGGEVTLSGTVSSREAKHRAERVVEDISGVNHVQNNLRVEAGNYFTSPGRGFGDNAQQAQMASSDPVKEVTDGNATPPAQKRN